MLSVVSCDEPVEREPAGLRTLDDAGVELRSTRTNEILDDSGESARDVSLAGDSRLQSLPFAPAISLDPVDGSKVSLTISTPTALHHNLIYYFSSEENRDVFVADPAAYVR